jgi:hypothetical protein
MSWAFLRAVKATARPKPALQDVPKRVAVR